MGFTIDFSVLNQKGTPALYSDIFANRPAAGYQGRLFIATDTAAIYEDTGTAWTLIANVSSGAGTLQQVTTNGNTSNVGISVTAGGVSTNNLTDTSLTTGSVPFAGAGGLISQDNANLFWDDTNNRLGINTNTPGNSLDVHTAGTNPTIAVNNTAGNQSAVSFLKSSVAKWRIGNTATDTFDIFGFTLGINALSISPTTHSVSFLSSIKIQQGAGFSGVAGYGGIGFLSTGVIFQNGTSLNTMFFDFGGFTAGRSFIFPNADGTIALTSNLSSYLPLTGGNLTGNITVSVATGLSALTLNNASLSGRNWSFINTTNAADTDLSLFYSGTSGGTKVTFANNGWVGIGKAPTTTLDVLGSGLFSGSLTANAGTFISTVTSQANGSTFGTAGSTGRGLIVQAGSTNQAIKFLNSAGGDGTLSATGTSTSLNYVFDTYSVANAFVINNNGTVLINTLTNPYNHRFISNGGTQQGISAETDIAGNDCVSMWNKATSGNNVFSAFYVNSSILAVGSITYNRAGGLTVYNTTSDYRIKSEILDFNALNILLNLKPKEFKIRDCKNKVIGFIAHELQEFFPQAVTGSKDEEKEDGTPIFQSVDYSQLTGLLTKAIQEQQTQIENQNTLIQSLIARIELLENK